jgi:hypothetical protein
LGFKWAKVSRKYDGFGNDDNCAEALIATKFKRTRIDRMRIAYRRIQPADRAS